MFKYKVKFPKEEVELDAEKLTEFIRLAYEHPDLDYVPQSEEGYHCLTLISEQRKHVNMFLVTEGQYLLTLMQNNKYELEITV